MTLTISAARRARPPRPSAPDPKPRRWAGVAFGLLVGMLVVCHGCHVGDHDDELSVNGEGSKSVRAGSVKERGEVPAPRPVADVPGSDEHLR